MQAERAPFLSVALVMAIVLSNLAIHRAHESDDVTVAERKAEAAAAQAVKDAQAARDQLDKLMRELDELDNKVARAANAIIAAVSDADRAAAKARLEQLLEAQHDMKARAAASRALANRGERIKCLCVPRQCIDNPLAKGCS